MNKTYLFKRFVRDKALKDDRLKDFLRAVTDSLGLNVDRVEYMDMVCRNDKYNTLHAITIEFSNAPIEDGSQESLHWKGLKEDEEGVNIFHTAE